jgi:hypothetical protein
MEWYEILFILSISIATPLIAHKLHWGTWFDDPFSFPYDTMEDFKERNGFK